MFIGRASLDHRPTSPSKPGRSASVSTQTRPTNVAPSLKCRDAFGEWHEGITQNLVRGGLGSVTEAYVLCFLFLVLPHPERRGYGGFRSTKSQQ